MNGQPAVSASHRPDALRSATRSSTQVTPMRICIAGSGAIGGTLAARLAAAGHDVSVIARGAQLQAIRESGLRLVGADATADLNVTLKASASAEFGVQDVIFVSVKAHSLPDMLPMLAPLMDERTIVVPTINGVPWWYFHGDVPARFAGTIVRSVDPDGLLLRTIPPRQIIGCVVYIASHVVAPGVIAAGGANRIVLGELDHQPSERLTRLCALVSEAGINAVPTARIRDALWAKLMANAATNPLSVVTQASLGELHADGGLPDTIRAVMREAKAVAQAYDAQPDRDVELLIEGGRKLGAFRTSMLQDFEKGQKLELAGIGDAVIELAVQVGVDVPVIRQTVAIARFLEAQRDRAALQPETPRHANVGRTEEETRQ